jgi:hypothetical protein
MVERGRSERHSVGRDNVNQRAAFARRFVRDCCGGGKRLGKAFPE